MVVLPSPGPGEVTMMTWGPSSGACPVCVSGFSNLPLPLPLSIAASAVAANMIALRTTR